MGREPELDVDEPACDQVFKAIGLRHVCALVEGHDGAHECGVGYCAVRA